MEKYEGTTTTTMDMDMVHNTCTHTRVFLSEHNAEAKGALNMNTFYDCIRSFHERMGPLKRQIRKLDEVVESLSNYPSYCIHKKRKCNQQSGNGIGTLLLPMHPGTDFVSSENENVVELNCVLSPSTYISMHTYRLCSSEHAA